MRKKPVNPKSLANLKPGQNKRPTARRTNILLEERTILIAEALSENILGRGIDKMAELIEKNYFVFTIVKASGTSPNKPWAITQKGDVRDNNPRKCLINGIEILSNNRVLVRGKTEENLSIAIKKQYGENFEFVLDWDGSTLTEFPDAKYVEAAKKNNWLVIEI